MTLDKILYTHPTSEIGLNSFRLDGLSFLGIGVMNDALHHLEIKSVIWKLRIALTIFLPITSQYFLTKEKLNPFGLGYFELLHWLTASRTSTSVILYCHTIDHYRPLKYS